MKQLWAPWRMPYIEGSEPIPGCLFCTKARSDDEKSDLILYRDRTGFVMMNLYPYNSGHVMAVPYAHVPSLADLEEEAGAGLFSLAQVSIRCLTEILHPDGFNLGINQGDIAGAGVADHVHLHIVPRWAGDTNFMPVLADAKVMPELLTATWEKLRPAFERQGEQ